MTIYSKVAVALASAVLLLVDGGSVRAELASLMQAHNTERSAVDVPALIWSDSLAKSAQSWADGCRFEHSASLDDTGENLYVTSRTSIAAEDVGLDAAKSWAAEKSAFDFVSNNCTAGKVCGHYTQMIWKSTTEVGCGVATCPTMVGFKAGTLVVCRYRPAGNIVAKPPLAPH